MANVEHEGNKRKTLSLKLPEPAKPKRTRGKRKPRSEMTPEQKTRHNKRKSMQRARKRREKAGVVP